MFDATDLEVLRLELLKEILLALNLRPSPLMQTKFQFLRLQKQWVFLRMAL